MISPPQITIIGAGLAGSEAAWQIAKRGVPVTLYEMRPQTMTKAHKTSSCAELVCSNSFRGSDLSNAVGLLKAELRVLGSLIMEAADIAKVPAGGALAVDRVMFSEYIDKKIKSHPLIDFVTKEIEAIPSSTVENPVIVATGPLTSKALAKEIERLLGAESLAFFDAISPVIVGESIDFTKVFRQSRYDKGEGADYLNVALTFDEYYAFVDAILSGEKYGGHAEVESDSIENLRPFEGCMPIEEMALRGKDTLRFGPLKPVGLTDPRTGKRPAAVVQLRQDNQSATLWNMVGMQTRLKQPEQLRIFRSLPGLEAAEFVRLGSVHRNSFIESPKVLSPTLSVTKEHALYFAGQITGVEGYVESTACGLVAGLNAMQMVKGEEGIVFPESTAIGSLIGYITDPTRTEFQPMNISYGLMKIYHEKLKENLNGGEDGKRKKSKINKNEIRYQIANEALEVLRSSFANCEKVEICTQPQP